VRGTILAHQSTLAHSALSRAGFYPQGTVAEIHRREAHSYAENLDQPFHADDEDRDGGGSGSADGDGQAGEDAWLEQQQSQQVARRNSPNARSRSRSSPSRSRSAMGRQLQLYDDDEERQRRTRSQLEEAQKRMQSVHRHQSRFSGMLITRLTGRADVLPSVADRLSLLWLCALGLLCRQFQLTRAFPALRFKKATDSLPSGVQLVSRQHGSKSARSARKSGQNT